MYYLIRVQFGQTGVIPPIALTMTPVAYDSALILLGVFLSFLMMLVLEALLMRVKLYRIVVQPMFPHSLSWLAGTTLLSVALFVLGVNIHVHSFSLNWATVAKNQEFSTLFQITLVITLMIVNAIDVALTPILRRLRRALPDVTGLDDES